MERIARIQFITPNGMSADDLREVLDTGVNWVQLRHKTPQSKSEVRDLAEAYMQLKGEFDFTLIINDHVDIARSVGADGVHLGQKDMPVKEAREILGGGKIVGGTANTLNQSIELAQDEVDYIGLGPFRHTTTKKNLDLLLGEVGIEEIIRNLRRMGHDTPVVAIGGIQDEDVQGLMDAGAHGVAACQMILERVGQKA